MRRFTSGVTAVVLLGALFTPLGPASGASAEVTPGLPVTSVPPQVLQSFFVFRTPPEAVPPRLVDAIATMNEQPRPIGGHGFNIALGQELTTPGQHAPLWAIPGIDRLTLWDLSDKSAIWGAVVANASAVRRGVTFSIPVPKPNSPDLVEIRGLVPDGVTGVKISQNVVVPVHTNAFTRLAAQGQLWPSRSWTLIRRR
jgi:hypothetical protein